MSLQVATPPRPTNAQVLSLPNGPPKSPVLTKRTPAKPTDPTKPNVHNVVLGNRSIKPWYPSLYPEELIGRRTEELYVCERCFRYSIDKLPYVAHRARCPSLSTSPPGTLIFQQSTYTVRELDGATQKLYAQNLSLFAKLFLDTKSVFYDVTTFLYYLLIHTPVPNSNNDNTPAEPQVVGFFSKEKMSWDNNNLACILVFPPWQRKGLGQLLMGLSYELSRRENRVGGPEKPLSTLGHLAYSQYWSHTLARVLLGRHVPSPQSHQKNPPTSVAELSAVTFIWPEDIVATLQGMDVLERRERKGVEQAVVDKVKLREWAERNGVRMEGPVDVGGFVEREDEEVEEGDEE